MHFLFLSLFLLFTCFSKSAKISAPPPDSLSLYRSLNLSPENAQKASGILAVENGGNSFVTRLWMFAKAKRTIDIQYFSFAKNLTGLIASQYLVAAADRGVQVRLIVDELAGKMNPREIKILDRHPNVEVRVYNPGVKIGRADKKIKYLIKNRKRLTRRMHNKTLTIDGEAAIIGGRNISDEYLDFSKKYNFRDRDVLILGEAAKDVEASFNDYWNSPYTVTCSELVGKTNKKFSIHALFAKLHQVTSDTAAVSPRVRCLVDSFPLDFKTMIHSGNFCWVKNVSFVSDKPGKNEDRKGRQGGLCDDTIISLIRNAKKSIDINTPYFITTDEIRLLLKEIVSRGVKVRVLTNSLASIDNDVAFSPYKRDREKNLSTGIELYEFRPDAATRFNLMKPAIRAPECYDAVFGFHPKSMVIDGNISLIGSYNVEPRSANLNTECIGVIRSEQISKHLLNQMEEEFLPQNSWKISKNFNPDKKAALKKRIKVVLGNIIPKKAL